MRNKPVEHLSFRFTCLYGIHATFSMAPKAKHRKAIAKTNNKAVEKDSDPENYKEDEVEESADDEDEVNVDDDFSLDEVLRLGGTRADYILLAGINDSNELVDGGKKGAIDDLEEGELEKFITKLGVRAYAKLQITKDEPLDGDNSEASQMKSENSEPTKAKSEAQTSIAKAKNTKSTEAGNTSAHKATGKKAKQNVNVFEFQQRQLLLIKPGGKWFDLEYSSEGTDTPQDESLVSQYKALAQKLYEAEKGLYKSKKNMQKGANSAWMKNVVSTGTLIDRMAAMTVLIQDAPVHSLEHVENLVGMVKKKGSRRLGLMALDTLRELLMSDLLPENRKLRTFAKHPFDQLEAKASGNKDARDRRLILWFFEHQLKHQMAEFVVSLDTVAHDTVPATKAKALTTAHELLCNRPEQERALLIQVINKLGDPEYKTAAKASYLLETLLQKHPNMKGVVCNEVERLMFRPNIALKAQYYSVCFLNQVLLSHEETDLATKLISIYFTFFRACVKKKDIESKMLSALLSGVNRAYPYAKAGDEKVKEQLDTLFKVVHLVKLNTAIQALMLLFQVMDSEQTISDRYYVALYRKLLDPGLSSCSKQNMFLNLLYKSLKADIVLRRVKAFVKRLLQVTCDQNPTFACGALFLVSEVIRVKPGLKLLLQEAGDGEEESFKDLAEDDDEEERFVDADKVKDEESEKPVEPKPTSSWVHHKNLKGGKSNEKYDPLHRNPLFCGADQTTLWELQRLSIHYHPSVSLFAKTILQGEFIQYTGDPLQDFTLIRFLDRFVFRNPKHLKGKQNTNQTVMQPKQNLTMGNIRSLPVNGEEFLSKEESQIPVDEVFFYRFFKKRAQEKQLRRTRGEGDNDSVEDVDDDEFENVLDSLEADSLFIDLPDDGLDFAGNVKNKSEKGKGKKGAEEDSDSDLDSDMDDEEVSLGSMDEEEFGDEIEEEGGAFMDPNDEDEPELEEDDGVIDEDSDDEMADIPDITPLSKKSKRKSSEVLDFSDTKQAKKKKGKRDTAVFASAEEFGDMLDENTGSKYDSGSINAMANKDKADAKQLKWEAQRDDWVHGRDAKTLRRKKAVFNKKKPFGKAKMGKKTFRK